MVNVVLPSSMSERSLVSHLHGYRRRIGRVQPYSEVRLEVFESIEVFRPLPEVSIDTLVVGRVPDVEAINLSVPEMSMDEVEKSLSRLGVSGSSEDLSESASSEHSYGVSDSTTAPESTLGESDTGLRSSDVESSSGVSDTVSSVESGQSTLSDSQPTSGVLDSSTNPMAMFANLGASYIADEGDESDDAYDEGVESEGAGSDDASEEGVSSNLPPVGGFTSPLAGMSVVSSQAEAEAKAQAEAEEKARVEAEAKAQAEAEEKARVEAQAKAQAEAEEKARVEAEAKAQAEAEEKARVEAQAKAQAEAEEKARAEAQAKAQAEVSKPSQSTAAVSSPPSPEQVVPTLSLLDYCRVNKPSYDDAVRLYSKQEVDALISKGNLLHRGGRLRFSHS